MPPISVKHRSFVDSGSECYNDNMGLVFRVLGFRVLGFRGLGVKGLGFRA